MDFKAQADFYRAVFDASYYSAAYPDVAAAYGNNADALLNHFISFGVKEGRNASAEFNPQAYRQRYEDLQAAFGSDMAAYCRHYVAYGKAERSRRTARLGHRTMGQRRAVHRHRARSRHPAR